MQISFLMEKTPLSVKKSFQHYSFIKPLYDSMVHKNSETVKKKHKYYSNFYLKIWENFWNPFSPSSNFSIKLLFSLLKRLSTPMNIELGVVSLERYFIPL